jgi:hypothetical protein
VRRALERRSEEMYASRVDGEMAITKSRDESDAVDAMVGDDMMGLG